MGFCDGCFLGGSLGNSYRMGSFLYFVVCERRVEIVRLFLRLGTYDLWMVAVRPERRALTGEVLQERDLPERRALSEIVLPELRALSEIVLQELRVLTAVVLQERRNLILLDFPENPPQRRMDLVS